MKARNRNGFGIIQVLAVALMAAVAVCPAQEERRITINSGSGIRTLKGRALRELRHRLEDVEKSNLERAQTFGAHFDAAKAAYAEAEKQLNGNPADYDAAEKAMEESRKELSWLAENEKRRSAFLVRKQELGDLLIDICEQLNITVGDPALTAVTETLKAAALDFDKGELVVALEKQDQAEKAMRDRIREEVAVQLEAAGELSAKGEWDKALALLAGMHKLAPNDQTLAEKVAEARSHAVTTLKVTAVVDGAVVPADVHVDGEWGKLPLVRDVEKGSKIELRVVYAHGTDGYYAASAYYVCDWLGEKEYQVELKPVEGPKSRKDWTVRFDSDKQADMVLLPVKPGSFKMGQARGDQTGELLHDVELREGYWLGRTEVTQAQWKALMEKNPSFNQGNDNLPVDNVSWDEAMLYCRKLTHQEKLAGRLPEGYVYTLPSEAQWEYACRAGNTGAYTFGDDDLALKLYGNVNGTEDGQEKAAPVGSYRANAWGFQDMHGNVSEWCRDLYATYKNAKAVEPTGPEDAEALRIRRGGDWGHSAEQARSFARDFATPSFHDECIGFRVALVKAGR